jgi:UDP-glucose 4-epimerase
MPRYLITGGCGFIGVNLIARLAQRGAGVRVLDNLSLGRRADVEPHGVELVVGDIRDRATVLACTRGVDTVIHLAAHTRVVESVENPEVNFDVNVVGTFNVLQACRASGVRNFILASTGGAILGEQTPPVHEKMVPRPIAPYGASKLCGEGYCSAFHGAYGLQTVALRFSNVYGPWSYHKGSVVAQFFRNLMQDRPLTVYGDGCQTRDFVYVGDLVEAILAASALEVGGESIQIASGRQTSLKELLRLMREVVTERSFEVQYEPARAGEILHNYALIDKARCLLGFEPRTELREGLRATWQWFKDHNAPGNADVRKEDVACCLPQK